MPGPTCAWPKPENILSSREIFDQETFPLWGKVSDDQTLLPSRWQQPIAESIEIEPEKLHLKLVYKIPAGIDPTGHLTWLLTAVGSLKHKPRKPHFPLNTHFTNYFVSIGAKWAHRFKKTLLWSHSILTHNGWLAPSFPSDQNSAGWLSISPTTNHQQSHRLIKFGTPSVSIGNEATWETVIAHYCVNTIINIAATILTIILLVLYLDHCH